MKRIGRAGLCLAMIIAAMLVGCSPTPMSDDPQTPSLEDSLTAVRIERSVEIQEQWLAAYDTLVGQSDSSAALAALIDLIHSDTSVAWVRRFSSGINVSFLNGYGGTILLMPRRGAADSMPSVRKAQCLHKEYRDGYVVPDGKKTLFLSAMYDEFAAEDDAVRRTGDEEFKRVDYQPFEFISGSGVSVSRLKSLSGSDYSFIRISSHGVAWPSDSPETAIEKVYLVTGETEAPSKSVLYGTDLRGTGIRTITSKRPDQSIVTFYMIDADIFASYNKFGDSKPFIQLAFCYSGLGGWPQAVIGSCKAGGATAFDWSIAFGPELAWSTDLLVNMCDTTRDFPCCLKQWYSEITPTFYDPDFERVVSIHYYGEDSLAFWPAFRLYALIPSVALCEDTILLVGKNFGDTTGKVLFDNQPIDQVLDWTDSIIEVIVPDGYSQGQTIQVKVAAHDDTTNEKTLLIGQFNMNTADVGLKLYGHYVTSEGPEDNWFDCRPFGKGTLSGSTFSYTIHEGSATNKLIVQFNPQNGDLISATFSSVADDGSAYSSFRMAGIKATSFSQSFVLWQGDHTMLTQYVIQAEDKINTADYSSELVSWMPTGAGGNGSFKIYLYYAPQ